MASFPIISQQLMELSSEYTQLKYEVLHSVEVDILSQDKMIQIRDKTQESFSKASALKKDLEFIDDKSVPIPVLKEVGIIHSKLEKLVSRIQQLSETERRIPSQLKRLVQKYAKMKLKVRQIELGNISEIDQVLAKIQKDQKNCLTYVSEALKKIESSTVAGGVLSRFEKKITKLNPKIEKIPENVKSFAVFLKNVVEIIQILATFNQHPTPQVEIGKNFNALKKVSIQGPFPIATFYHLGLLEKAIRAKAEKESPSLIASGPNHDEKEEVTAQTPLSDLNALIDSLPINPEGY